VAGTADGLVIGTVRESAAPQRGWLQPVSDLITRGSERPIAKSTRSMTSGVVRHAAAHEAAISR
jgi:hypothetical protein